MTSKTQSFMSRIGLRKAILGLATLASLGVVAAGPALADQDDWHRGGWRHEREWRGDRDWREHEWRAHEWREREWREYHPYFYAPGYVYAPPPVYEAAPVAPSLNFVFPLDLR